MMAQDILNKSQEYVNCKNARSVLNSMILDDIALAGYSLDKLLSAIGISKNYYYNYRNGYSIFRREQIEKIIYFIGSYGHDDDFKILTEHICFYWLISVIL